MLRFLLTRVSLVIPTFIGITLLVFVLVRLIPGDPIETMAGERGIDPAEHARLVHEYGFDRPVIVQYGLYISRLVQGDLGRSIVTHKSVIEEFSSLFPATVELSLCALAFALLLGIPAGIIAAVRRNSIFDQGIMGLSLTGYSMPIFWWGLLLILLFSVQLGWTPVSGRIAVLYFVEAKTGFLLIDTLLAGDIDAFWSAVSHLILPAIVLGTVPLAVIARMTRSAMLEVLGEDYIRTARAKGLSSFRVVAVHAFRGRFTGFVGACLDAELVHFDAPVVRGGCQCTEQFAAEGKDAPQAGSVGDSRLHRREPALDVALQRVVSEALVMRLMRFAEDLASCVGREHGMPTTAVAPARGEIGVRLQIVPAGGERGPVAQRLGFEQVAHDVGGGEGKAIMLQLVMQGGRIGEGSHANTLAGPA